MWLSGRRGERKRRRRGKWRLECKKRIRRRRKRRSAREGQERDIGREEKTREESEGAEERGRGMQVSVVQLSCWLSSYFSFSASYVYFPPSPFLFPSFLPSFSSMLSVLRGISHYSLPWSLLLWSILSMFSLPLLFFLLPSFFLSFFLSPVWYVLCLNDEKGLMRQTSVRQSGKINFIPLQEYRAKASDSEECSLRGRWQWTRKKWRLVWCNFTWG